MKAFMRAVFADDTETLDTIMRSVDEARKSATDPHAPKLQGVVCLLLTHEHTPDEVALLWRVREIMDTFERENTPLLLSSEMGVCGDMTKDFLLFYNTKTDIRANAACALVDVAHSLFFSEHTRWDSHTSFAVYGLHDAISLKSVDEIEKYMQENLQDVYYMDIMRSAVRAARAILEL